MRALSKLAVILMVSGALPASAGEPYKLGRGDVVEVIVSAGGQLARRTQIGSAGTIAIPLVGEIEVAGLTTSSAATRIEEAFRSRGNQDQVSAVVEVVTYRPVYVAGAVPKPGPFEYRPGMTVRQLLATAGGDMAGAEKADVIPEVLQSEYDDAVNAFVHSQARMARLRAQATGATALSVKNIDASGLAPARVREITSIEENAWKASEAETARLKEFTDNTAKVLNDQVADLSEQLKQEEVNIGLAEAEVQRIKAAFNKGVIAAPRVSDTQQSLALVKIRRAETAARIAEARRNLLEITWRFDQHVNARKLEAFAAMQKESQELARAESAVAAARAKLQQARVAPRTPRNAVEQVLVSIHSEANEERPASLDTEVMPGDTVQVTKQMADASSSPVQN